MGGQGRPVKRNLFRELLATAMPEPVREQARSHEEHAGMNL
jgi:hypothetical protein